MKLFFFLSNKINFFCFLILKSSYIYAVGGRDDCMELSSAERYNPHTNTWSPIVAMTSRRSGVSNNYTIRLGACFIIVYFFWQTGWIGRCERAIVCRWRLRRDRILENDRSL